MDTKDFKIAVAGTGYVGLSIATLLSQHHRIYRNGSHCRTVHRQLPQTMDPAYRYDRRNHRMLPFRNHMVLPGRKLHFQSCPCSLRNPFHTG